MDIKELQRIVINALEDVKGQDIHLYDTMTQTSMFDRIVVVSGTSNRQTRALAMAVRDQVKQEGGKIVGMEGEKTGEWVLVDLGDMVVHVMQPAIRAYYRLEEIWGEKEISLATAKRKPRKPTSEKIKAVPKKATSDEAPAEKASNKTAVRKAPAKSTTKESVASKKVPTAKKAPARASNAAEGKSATEPVKRTRAKSKAAE